MDVFVNANIYDERGVVGAGLRVRCAPDGGSFYPPDPAAFEIGKVYHLIADDRSLAIRITQFLTQSSRPRTEVRFVTLGPVAQDPLGANIRAWDEKKDTTIFLSAADPSADTDVVPPRTNPAARKPFE